MEMMEVPEGLEWFNSPPLRFGAELKGKIVLLDFWTYCCINCIHVLPDLAFLEKKYATAPFTVIGVHSAKFDNEKDSENIRKAILRYDIRHPVVNDPTMLLWQQLGIRSWPSFVLIGPDGRVAGTISGEGKREILDRSIAALLREYPFTAFNPTPLPLTLEQERTPKKNTLSFPAKLAIDSTQRELFISDSNHHRILVTSLEGKTLQSIGCGLPGWIDGPFDEARFYRPQGIAYHPDKNILYVADAENHTLRAIDFTEKRVTTLAGNGTQGTDYQGGKKGTKQSLSTPWDIAIASEKNRLWIAMAGTHQIWEYPFATEKARAFSGSGAEKNWNSDDLMEAAWAQPSGLSVGGQFLYIADSESSSIRAIDLKKGRTMTLAGGDSRNPNNLFCFGCEDGVGDAARFQHPLGVLWLQKEHKLLIADTYNHCIRSLDPTSGEVRTLAGSGQAGHQDGIGLHASFAEPSGLATDEQETLIFIADTNNHLIRLLNKETGRVTTLEIV
jgi:sugar lactone lactonase YvrE